MIAFPNCKINLGLHIINKRDAGYHDLETVFLPVPFTDVLEIGVLHLGGVGHMDVTGLPINTGDNLCTKAYNLLKQNFPNLPEVQIHLHKVIPLGAGLGGGSSDAAFTLQLLNQKFNLKLKTEQLLDYALRLGSDCPFFIINKPCLATSRGEILQPVSIDLSNYKLLIVNPRIHIDTGWAFSNVTPGRPAVSIKEIIEEPVETWKGHLQNDFEALVFAVYPQIKKIKEDMYSNGAVYASLSGSGSTVYGIFKKENPIATVPFAEYFYKILPL
jgi:4-diphosphocytidyl-2-C-methyl-D-erythritol kinase